MTAASLSDAVGVARWRTRPEGHQTAPSGRPVSLFGDFATSAAQRGELALADSPAWARQLPDPHVLIPPGLPPGEVPHLGAGAAPQEGHIAAGGDRDGLRGQPKAHLLHPLLPPLAHLLGVWDFPWPKALEGAAPLAVLEPLVLPLALQRHVLLEVPEAQPLPAHRERLLLARHEARPQDALGVGGHQPAGAVLPSALPRGDARKRLRLGRWAGAPAASLGWALSHPGGSLLALVGPLGHVPLRGRA